MQYFITDVTKFFRNRSIIVFMAIMLLVVVFDPISLILQGMSIPEFFYGIGDNPYQYWLLTNHAGWGNTIYYTLFWVFPVLFTGLVAYNERTSSFFTLLVIRESRIKYIFAKVTSVFVLAFVCFSLLLLINILSSIPPHSGGTNSLLKQAVLPDFLWYSFIGTVVHSRAREVKWQ